MKSIFEMNDNDVFSVSIKEKEGSILSRTYWKILAADKRRAFGSSKQKVCYSVIRCNKNGKEFTQLNGYTLHIGEKYPEIEYVGNFTKAPVSRDKIDIGVMKRRRQHLIDSIDYMSTELDLLNEQLGYNEEE